MESKPRARRTAALLSCTGRCQQVVCPARWFLCLHLQDSHMGTHAHVHLLLADSR